MRIILYLIFICLISCKTKNEKETVKTRFVKIVYDLNDTEDSIKFSEWKLKNLKIKSSNENQLLKVDTAALASLYYSDNEYNVYGNCMGEFGGALYFISKQDTSNVYYMDCTCPVMIEKRNDAYYITRSLAHMDLFSRVIKLNSPKELIKVRKDSLLTNWKEERFKNMDKQQRWKMKDPGEIVVDTSGFAFNIFFNYKDKDFLIYSDHKKTFVGQVINHKIEVLDSILDRPTWRTNETPNEINNGFYHYSYTRESGTFYKGETKTEISSGDIYLRNDTIVIANKYIEKFESENPIK